MFDKVKMGQEAPFKGNSGKLGLFSNGRADGNWKGVVFQMGVSITVTEQNVLNKKMISLNKTWRNDVIRNGKSFSKTL